MNPALQQFVSVALPIMVTLAATNLDRPMVSEQALRRSAQAIRRPEGRYEQAFG